MLISACIKKRAKDSLMPRFHLAVLTTRNKTWRLWKRIS